MRLKQQCLSRIAKRGRTSGIRGAFSLVELLVVVGILVVLIAILMPTLNNARKSAQKLACASNLRQIMVAARAYAQDEGNGIFFPGALYTGQDDSFEALFPHYLTDYRVLICPSTQNVVKSIADTRNNALGGPSDSSGGHSYEIRGFEVGGYNWPDGRTTVGLNVGGANPGWRCKTYRCPMDPSRDGIIMDGDDPDGTPDDINNWPNPTDNHGAEGENIAFRDGHVAWCRTGRDILDAFVVGHYTPGPPNSVTSPYGLELQGITYVWLR